MKCNSISFGQTARSTFRRLTRNLRSMVVMFGVLLCLSLSLRALAITYVTGDIYVYTSPGVLSDVTAEYHEDPIITINGVPVQIYPNYNNGYVYDAAGDVLGFIFGVVQLPPP